MDAGMVLSAAQTLLAAFQCQELRELCSMFRFEPQLEALKCSVTTIQSVLLDVESKHQKLTNEGRDWLDKLKKAVYDADDMFDEFITVAQRLKSMPGGKISKKVRTFFSNDNQFLFAAKTSRKIKNLRDKLDKIAEDHAKFGFSVVHEPAKRREKTLSYVKELSIIGRDTDKETILGMLLRESDSFVNIQENVSYVSIVGFGGLGKTALAQLVFNDVRIQSAFELTKWVCVSEDFGVIEILSKMVEKRELESDELLREVRRTIQGKKYLLVLDDVWNEDHDEWVKLRGFLDLGEKGSRVLVTSRSKNVATAIGNDEIIHELGGLSEEKSWELFRIMAFGEGKEDSRHTELEEIGREIVKKCANVPLSIRVIGSLLYGQDKSKWESFRSMDLLKMREGNEKVMDLLMFSYYNLPHPLKICFSYCALFPKDYVIQKKDLICLWLAQGYLEPSNDVHDIEVHEVGEEYFSLLSQRCFFQDFKKDAYDEIEACKMHDLIHDLALEVAGKESQLIVKESYDFDAEIRHFSFGIRGSLLFHDKMKGLRTFLRPLATNLRNESETISKKLVECRRLRVLDLHYLGRIRDLPSTISKLSQLRYLDLSYNDDLKMLPESITRLHNLQVLKLFSCWSLEELPDGLRNLVNLRHLDLRNCNGLTHMPAGIDSLTGLCTLSRFVLGGKSSKKAQIGQLRDLLPLNNVRGKLWIRFKKGYLYNGTNAEQGAYLSNKEHIKALTIEDEGCFAEQPTLTIDERLLESLEPPRDLRKIDIRGYKGIELPRWAATLAISLPRLVDIYLSSFHGLRHLPPLSQLQHLKSLELIIMPNVELIEDDNGAADVPWFPSLEKLHLTDCPNLKSFPECRHVKDLRLWKVNEALTFSRQRDYKANATTATACTTDNNHTNNNILAGDVVNLNKLEIENVELLNSLFGESVQSIHSLTLDSLEEDSLSTVVEKYQRCASAIEILSTRWCQNLKSLSGVEHLPNLKELVIYKCRNLRLEEEEGMPWKPLHALRHLLLAGLPQLVNDLPKGFQYLTSLRVLQIHDCQNLESISGSVTCLNSLRSLLIEECPKLKLLPEAIFPFLKSLTIWNCDGLKERYSEPNGKDWSKICHIPEYYFR